MVYKRVKQTKLLVLSFNFGFLILIMITSLNAVVAQSNDMVMVSFSFEIKDGNTDSSAYQVKMFTGGSSLSSTEFEIRFISSENTSFAFSQNTTVETNNNILGNYNSIEVNTKGGSSNSPLFILNISSGVLFHLRHVYYEWKLGAPTPNGQGFGLGALQDSLILENLINTPVSTLEEASSLGEQVINLLLGLSIDYDNNGTAINPSDGYGYFSYSYGMKDHIRNAYSSEGAPQDLIDNGSSSISEFSSFVGADKTSFIQSLNSSSLIGARIYNASFKLINSTNFSSIPGNLSELENLANQYIKFINKTYRGFRSKAMDFEFSTEVLIDLSNSTSVTTQPTNTETTPFSIPLLFLVITAIIVYQNKKKEP